jgi:hypothetical protein
LFDGEEENSLASHVKKTTTLELRFCKGNVVGKKHVGRSYININFCAC